VQSRASVLSRADRDRLLQFITLHEAQIADEREALARLSARVESMHVVDADKVPHDMVTMYSQVRLCDLDTERSFIITAALPEVKPTALLARAYPMGALLGSRVGDEIVWRSADRQHRVRVEEVLFQPESSARRSRARSVGKRLHVRESGVRNRFVRSYVKPERARAMDA